MDLLKIFTLGKLTIEQDGVILSALPRKAEALFVYLACTGQPHEREVLAGLLWGEHSQERANTSLRVLLTNLRRLLGPYLTITRRTVAVRPDSQLWLDVTDLESNLDAIFQQQAQHGNLSVDDLARLAETVGLYQGDFLTGFTLRDSPEFESWLLLERERLQLRMIEALEDLAVHYLKLGSYVEGISQTQRLLRLDPYREATHRQLMRLFAYNDQRNAALAQYEQCRQILAKELGIEPMPETIRLYQEIRSGILADSSEKALAQDIAAETPSSQNIDNQAASVIEPPAVISSLPELPLTPRLPVPATPFIGRAEELDRITNILADPTCRILTLLGPGGIGKTRLVIEATRQMAERPGREHLFPQGIYFISLTSLRSPDFLAPTIADALNFTFYGTEPPTTQLLNYLSEKRLLLVLDNFEHLLTGVDFLTDILQQAPEVKLLTASRERLNLQGERLLPIQGLAFPSTERDFDHSLADSLERYSAVQLFLQQAWAVDPDLVFSVEDRRSIIRICQLVEGIPLAVELAAVWVRMLSCQEIAQEIEQNLDFLVTSLRNVPERHRSLRAVFDYSWQLLSSQEQRVFRNLSVFRGGFSRKAAQAVVGATLPQLLALVDKSLLRRIDEGRYEQHLLLSQYAAAKLDELPHEKEQAERRFLAYYVDFLQQRERTLQGGPQQQALAEISLEIENVRASWQQAIARQDLAAIDQVIGTLFYIYEMRSWFQEGVETFGGAVADLFEPNVSRPDNVPFTVRSSLPGPDLSRANLILGRLLTRHGWFAFRLGAQKQAHHLLQKGLAILQSLEPRPHREIVFTLNCLGAIHARRGDARHARAKAYLQESVAICQEVDNQFDLSIALNLLGWLAYLEGDYDQARELCGQSLTLHRQLHNRWGMAFCLNYLGQISCALGQYHEAQQLFQESLLIRQEMDDRLGFALSLNHLGEIAQALESYQEANYLYQESLSIFKAIGSQWGLIASLTNLGSTACALMDYAAAKSAFKEALTLAMEIQALPLALNALVGVTQLLLKTEQIDSALMTLTLILNHPAASRGNQDKAAQFLAELEPQLSAEMIQLAQSKVQDKTLEAVVGEIVTW